MLREPLVAYLREVEEAIRRIEGVIAGQRPATVDAIAEARRSVE
jgi:hypothetical protein